MRSAGEQPHSDYPRPRRHGGRLLGLALIVPLAIAPAPALAFELFGIHLFGEKADEAVVDPVRYALSFDPGTDDDELADALRDASIMLADEKRPVSDRKSTRLNSSHVKTSYAVFCLKNKIE